MSLTKDGFYKSFSGAIGNNNYLLEAGGGHIAWGNGSNQIPYSNGTVNTHLNADMTDGLHVHGGRNNEANKIVRTDGSGYIQAGWINTTSGDMGSTAFSRIYVSNDAFIRYVSIARFKTVLFGGQVGSPSVPIYWTGSAFATCIVSFGNSSYGEHNANNINDNGIKYYTSNGPSTSLGATTSDGALYSQAYNTSWVAQIAQDYRNGGLYVRGKNNGTWQSWYRVWDNRTTYVSGGKGYIGSTQITQVNNSDTVDGFHHNHLMPFKYTYNGYTNSGSDWYLQLNTSDWISEDCTIFVRGGGSNTSSDMVIHVLCRENRFWGWETSYNGVRVNGIAKETGAPEIIYLRMPSSTTSIDIKSTFPLTITKGNYSSKSYMSLGEGLFANYIYGRIQNADYADTLSNPGKYYWANLSMQTSPNTSTSPTFNITTHNGEIQANAGIKWAPGTNIRLPQSANGQEWSFDISRNGYTGGYWHVWDSAYGSLLTVYATEGYVLVNRNLGVGGRNTTYKLYVVGNSLLTGTTYFGSTSYWINNGGVEYMYDIRGSRIRLVDNWVGFYTSNNAGGNRLGYIQTDGSYMYFRKENGNAGFNFNGNLVPSSNLAANIGTNTLSWNRTFTRYLDTRHLDATAEYTGDMTLYIGYGAVTPTQTINFYYSTGTRNAAATSRIHYAQLNSNGLYALVRFGVNGQNTGYTLHVNGTGNFENNIWVRGSGVYLRLGPQNSSHAHYETNAGTSHWFNKRVDVNGDIYLYGTSTRIQKSNEYVYAKGFYHLNYGSAYWVNRTDGGAACFNYGSKNASSPSYVWGWAADNDYRLYSSSYLYKSATHTINNPNTSNTWLRIATITISGTGLSIAGFTAIFSNRECLDNTSFILTLSIRRNNTTSAAGVEFYYNAIQGSLPRTISLRSNDNQTFYVYFQSAASSWTTYYNVTKIMTEGNVTYENVGTTSPIAGSITNKNASLGGNVSNADTLDGYHASGLFTAFGNSGNNITATIGGTTKTFTVNYASNAGNANYANYSGYSHKLDIYGYSSNGLSFYQTSGSFDGADGWAHYIIANHGDGASYYHYTIRLPFWGPPQYRRQTGNTSSVTGWYTFLTTENWTSIVDGRYLPLSGGWMNWTAQINFRGSGGSTSVYSRIGYATGTINGVQMHTTQTNALYICTNGDTSATDNAGLAIDNDGVTVFGAGDAGSVFRVINEDNVSDGAQFLVTKSSGATTKYSHTAQRFISNVATGTQPYACSSTTCNTNLNADLLDSYHANRFAFTYNSANYGSSSGVTVNDLVTKGVSNASHGMIYAATDNPVGSSNWVHVWSQQWTIATTSSWVSQIALGVQQGTGMWYRTTSGNVVGRAWTRVLDSSNWTSYVDGRYVKKTGDTMTGALYINYAQDVGLNQNGSLIIGNKASTNLAFDDNEIMARNNSAASILYINAEGGTICLNETAGYTGIGTNSPSQKLHVAGLIRSTCNGNTLTIGAQNSSWIHYEGSTNHWFNTNIYVNGTLYWYPNTAYYWNGNAGYSSTYYVNNWFRTYGACGWYSESYGGGWWMTDSTWLRNYNNKSLFMYTSGANSSSTPIARFVKGWDCGDRAGYDTVVISSNDCTSLRLIEQDGTCTGIAAGDNYSTFTSAASNGMRFFVHGNNSSNIYAGMSGDELLWLRNGSVGITKGLQLAKYLTSSNYANFFGWSYVPSLVCYNVKGNGSNNSFLGLPLPDEAHLGQIIFIGGSRNYNNFIWGVPKGTGVLSSESNYRTGKYCINEEGSMGNPMHTGEDDDSRFLVCVRLPETTNGYGWRLYACCWNN